LLLEWGRLHFVRGEWEAASRYLDQSKSIFAEQGKRSGLRTGEQVLAERDVLDGHPTMAQERLVPLLDRSEMEERGVTIHILPTLAWAYLELGEVGQAARTVAEAIRRARAGTYRRGLVDALRVQAMVALRRESCEDAARALEEGLALAQGMPYPRGEARLLQVAGELHLQLGQPDAARERLEAALAIFHLLGARKDVERTEQLLAVLG
jgi:hypothetical protein